MIRILLVEDNALVRKGLADLLQGEPDMEMAGTVAGGLEALELLQNGLQPDVIVTDLNMPGINGIELTGQLLQVDCSAGVIILTMHRQTNFLDKALAAGAKGYLLKGEDFDDLFSGIRAVYAGETYVSPSLRSDHAAF